MSILLKVLLAVQVICALVMIILILMQQGKGASAGATFGSGASGSLFGASGNATFLSRTTAVLATIFFASTLVFAYYGSADKSSNSSVLSNLPGLNKKAAKPKAAESTTAAKTAKKKEASAAEQIPTATAPVAKPDATPKSSAETTTAPSTKPVVPAATDKKSK